MKYYILADLPEDIEFVEGGAGGKCTVCGESTSYVEINYQCWMCSSECLGEMDKGYYEALTGRNHPDNSALLEVVKELTAEVQELRDDVETQRLELEELRDLIES